MSSPFTPETRFSIFQKGNLTAIEGEQVNVKYLLQFPEFGALRGEAHQRPLAF
jgi:hypothetical protein